MVENEEDTLFGTLITAHYIYLLLFLLIYGDVLTENTKNKGIVLKPILNEYSGDQAKDLRV